MRKSVRALLLLVLFLSAISIPLGQSDANAVKVYKVPITNDVEKGLHAFLKRSFKEADEAGAKTVILEIDTLGGFIDAAGQIGKLIDDQRKDTEVIAYINDRAISAGAYIALHADKIYMSPTGKMGAAQAVQGTAGNAADAKSHSYWFAEMTSAAESSRREPIYAQAMADPDVNVPEYNAAKGKLLTLTASQAKEVGYSEGTVSSFDALLRELGLENAEVVSTDVTFAESVARIITNPVVVPILLSIAGLGLVLELYSPGFGVPGTMALVSLGLFFFGHLVAGLAGYEALILFIIGVGLIIAEFFLAGGIAGVLGAVAVVVSIILAGGNPMYMAISLLIAIAIAVIGMVIIMKFFGRKLHLLNKMVLMDATDTESGYVSNVNRTELIGKIALAITPLRPSGTVNLDGERIDVVSEGSYIEKGKDVMIVKVEGSRIVVREYQKKGDN
ncbi:NfeD family protein [Sporosarcina cyprini]|uniref:NfeD family protein n=1 Tax=Sporosarcina cyprini TaxID=2910523 RepID=UPI001EE076F0|nr:nodulation protein NfeD [Sporosarcina cyprini]MCG3089110.1 nodulation protein NfeD [Sporosarcina cyprini]